LKKKKFVGKRKREDTAPPCWVLNTCIVLKKGLAGSVVTGKEKRKRHCGLIGKEAKVLNKETLAYSQLIPCAHNLKRI